MYKGQVVSALREKRGLSPLSVTRNLLAEKQQAYEHLADVVEGALDMKTLKEIMEGV